MFFFLEKRKKSLPLVMSISIFFEKNVFESFHFQRFFELWIKRIDYLVIISLVYSLHSC